MSRPLPLVAAGPAAASLLCVLALTLPIATAKAASERVKSACKDDYFRHCSSHALGSDSLRQCMRGVGENLSTGCLVALVEDGEITKQDIERHKAKQAEAKPDKPAADAKPASSAATASASTKAAPARADGPPKPASSPKVVSIGKTELPATSPKTKAANAKQGSPPKVASIGKPELPAASPKAKAADPKPTLKQETAKATLQPPAAKIASKTATAAQPKPVASAAAVPPKPPATASKPAARQPGIVALSGEGAQLSAAVGQRFTRNVCHAKTIAGDPISQTCAIDEKCCFSGLAGKLRCVPQTATCDGF